MASGHDIQIAMPAFYGPQKCFGRVPSYATLLVHFEVATTFVIAAIEIIYFGNACLCRSLAKSIQDIPAQTLFFYSPLTASSMKIICACVMVFSLHE